MRQNQSRPSRRPDWEALKAKLAEKRIRVVPIDLLTSWIMADRARDDFTGRLFDAINGMLLDMLAAISEEGLRR